MRFTARRLGILACSVAFNVFLLLSPAATATVSAARCQQECDAEYSYGGGCDELCDYQYFNQVNGGVSYDDWQACHSQCRDWWVSCSMSAVFCYESNCWIAFCYADPHEPYAPVVVHCESNQC
jgi:hypothetical protein